MVLLAVRVLDESGYATMLGWLQVLIGPVDAGVDVINLSLGSDADHQGLRAALGLLLLMWLWWLRPATTGLTLRRCFRRRCLTVTASDSADFPALFSASGSHVALLAPGP